MEVARVCPEDKVCGAPEKMLDSKAVEIEEKGSWVAKSPDLFSLWGFEETV